MSETAPPLNALERMLIDAQQGKVPLRTFLDTFVYSQVFILLDHPVEHVQAIAELSPLVVHNDHDAEPLLAVFTSAERAEAAQAEHPTHPYIERVSGQWLLKGVPRDVGLVVNPGWKTGFELAPKALQRWLLELPIY